jgi:hypothetical protein
MESNIPHSGRGLCTQPFPSWVKVFENDFDAGLPLQNLWIN